MDKRYHEKKAKAGGGRVMIDVYYKAGTTLQLHEYFALAVGAVKLCILKELLSSGKDSTQEVDFLCVNVCIDSSLKDSIRVERNDGRLVADFIDIRTTDSQKVFPREITHSNLYKEAKMLDKMLKLISAAPIPGWLVVLNTELKEH